MISAYDATIPKRENVTRLSDQYPEASDFWRPYAARVKDMGELPPQEPAAVDDSSVGQPAAPRTVGVDRRALAQTPPEFTVRQWKENFIPLARWAGRILDVDESGFTAVVTDQLNRSTPEEEAQIPIDEISDVDHELVKPGALFYWSIGYRVQASGQRSRESIIRFRRLPRWSIEEVEHARRRVDTSHLKVESAELQLDPGPA